MSLPVPEPGLVIRYAYLWTHEAADGREEGIKDRPCAVVLAVQTDASQTSVLVMPITHAPPRNHADAIELPAATKRRLGLDDARSWIVLTELNRFIWPGPDIRPVYGADGGLRWSYGFLPADLYRRVRDAIVDRIGRRDVAAIQRSD